MNTRAIRAVLFDLDGTLLDTAQDLVGSLNFLRAREGLPPVDVADYRQYVSRGALGLIQVGMPAGNEASTQQRKERFLSHYAENTCHLTRPFDGVEPMLLALEGRAVPWGIVTNKPEYLTLPIVRAVGWSRRAACVICGDTLAFNKPDPAPLRLACEIIGVEPAQTLMVGDDPRDLEAGQAAGTHIALAAYGYGVGEVLGSDAPMGHLLETPGDILNIAGIEPLAHDCL